MESPAKRLPEGRLRSPAGVGDVGRELGDCMLGSRRYPCGVRMHSRSVAVPRDSRSRSACADVGFPAGAKADGRDSSRRVHSRHPADPPEPIATSATGLTKREGHLRLDARAAAMKGGETGPAIVPGNSEQSLIVRRMLGLDGDDRMPKDGDPLPAAQIALIRAWIDQGATWPATAAETAAPAPARDPEPKHWAYRAPARPPTPDVRNSEWVRTPIDRFVLARLEKEGLEPSPEAPLETLVRRVSLDLDRPAAIAAGGGRSPGRRRARRSRRGLLTSRRSSARLAALRRALGAAVARSRALRRLARLRKRSAARDVEVPRLGDRRAQPRHAVRSLHHRADRRRHAAERHARISSSPAGSIATR